MKKSIKISLLVIIFLVVGVFLYNYNLSTSSSPKKAYAEITFPDLGNGTETYFSEKFNMNINYPKGWYIQKENNKDDGSILVISSIPNDNNFPGLNNNIFYMGIGDTLQKYSGEPINEWVDIFESDFPEGISNMKNSEITNVDGKDILIKIFTSYEKNSAGDRYSAYIPHKDKVLSINGPLVDSKYGQYFLDIINSFKFGK